MVEESKAASLIASLSNIPEADVETKIAVLQEIVEVQAGEIAELKKILEDNDLWSWE